MTPPSLARVAVLKHGDTEGAERALEYNVEAEEKEDLP